MTEKIRYGTKTHDALSALFEQYSDMLMDHFQCNSDPEDMPSDLEVAINEAIATGTKVFTFSDGDTTWLIPALSEADVIAKVNNAINDNS